MDSLPRPFIIPIFIPHAGCPHQCVFCNQSTITRVEHTPVSKAGVRSIVEGFLRYKKEGRSPVQISFYGGTFLGLEKGYVKELLAVASEFVSCGQVDSIRFSTRPDTIDAERLGWLAEFPVSTVELGVQSMDNTVLSRAGRGHLARHTVEAVGLLRARGYETGLQMMVGLPGESNGGALATAGELARLAPDFVRIYPTVVLKNSPLAGMYRRGEYTPLSLDRCVTVVKELFLLFYGEKIPVVRMGLQASEDFENSSEILDGPYHPAFGHMVFSEIFLDMALAALKQRGVSGGNSGASLDIRVHSRDISRMRGLKNKNIAVLKEKLDIEKIKVIPDDGLMRNSIGLNNTVVHMKSLKQEGG